MKYIELEQFLIQNLTHNFVDFRFGNTYETLYSIKWKKQELFFFGYNVGFIKYYKEDGTLYVTPTDYEVGNTGEFLNEEINVVEFVSSVGNTLLLGLKDSTELNKHKLIQWFLELKEKILSDTTLGIAEIYYKEIEKLYGWSQIVRHELTNVRNLIDSFESAANEPDLNIMADYRKRINQALDDLENKKYKEYWKKEN